MMHASTTTISRMVLPLRANLLPSGGSLGVIRAQTRTPSQASLMQQRLLHLRPPTTCITRQSQCLTLTPHLSRPLTRRPPAQFHPHRTFLTTLLRRYRYRSHHSPPLPRLPLLTAIFLATTGLTLLIYGIVSYRRFLRSTLHNYPPPVAAELRKALYYTLEGKEDYKLALGYYFRALEKARECGMEVWEREVTGIKVEVARCFERAGREDKAVEVLGGVLGDVERGLEEIERELAQEEGVGEGKVVRRGDKWTEEVLDTPVGGTGSTQVMKKRRNREEIEKERVELLKRAIGVGVKMGDLYGQMKKFRERERILVSSVEKALKEAQVREQMKIMGKGEESKETVATTTASVSIDKDATYGQWLTDMELGILLETLASHYESSDQHMLASPLYLHALSYFPSKSCHAVTIMNNLAASLSQQPLPPNSPISRSEVISNAVKWAEKGLEVAATIKPPERTEECDIACVTALCNLADFAQMLGERGEAEKRYVEAISIAKAIGSEEGTKAAEEGMARLEKSR